MSANRFLDALNAADANPPASLTSLASLLVSAIAHTEAEGQRPEDDPAVLVLGSFIAFHTHSDLNTVGGYRQLLSLCAYRAEQQGEMQ